MQIEIKITERRAELQGSCVLVCGNTGDTVKFIFDNEWGQYSNKTARFGFIKEGAWYYSDVLFDGSVCEIPMLSGIDFVEVGVYAGNLSTTTPARVPTKRSILCRNGLEHEPPPADVYNEILAAVSGKLSTTGGTVTGDYYKDGKAFIHEGNLDLLDGTDNVAIVKKATGNALTLDSSQAPLHGLKLFGKTEQDGTPTPTEPKELKSVGDSGSFTVKIQGENDEEQSLTITDTLRGIGDIADEKDFARGVTTQRFGIVDLGTLNWRYTTAYSKFRSSALTDKASSNDNDTIPNALCSAYTIVTPNDTNGTGVLGVSISIDNEVLVRNETFTDATALKNAMSGVMLCYELETPIETPIPEAELNDYRALLTHKGTTTILSEADAEVEFYVNKPNAQSVGNVHAQINKDYLKLQQAIITLGGSTL